MQKLDFACFAVLCELCGEQTFETDTFVSRKDAKDRKDAKKIQRSNIALISAKLIASFAKSKVPCSFIARAAFRKAPNATRVRPLPTLMRLTPISDSSSRVRATPAIPINTFTGRASELTNVEISSLRVRPGA